MKEKFVGINYITTSPEYAERMEALFSPRARAIDKEPGFIKVEILRPKNAGDPYLIVSHWESEKDFENWTKSEAFMVGHKRAFEDMAKAKEEGKPAPMASHFKVYKVIAE